MIRSKGEAGTGNIVEAVRHLREIVGGIRRLGTLGPEQLAAEAKELAAPIEVVARGRRDAAGCPCRCSARAASRRRPTPRWSCSSAPRATSSARASSSPRTPSAAPGRSSRRPRTSSDPERVAAASIELGEPMRGDDIARARGRGRAAPAPRRVVTDRVAVWRARPGGRRRAARSACWPARATSRPTPGCWRRSARRRSRSGRGRARGPRRRSSFPAASRRRSRRRSSATGSGPDPGARRARPARSWVPAPG